MNALNTPILFLVFNRVDTTYQVFDKIREAKPVKLYIAADGPRNELEAIKCDEVRSIVQKVDWPCEVVTLFREENLGCGPAVSEAITWFFSQEEQGIILEDDCLPDLSFFNYCEVLLERYKGNNSVWHIAGTCFIPNTSLPDNSYYFSMFNNIWGWATWKNRWEKYRFDVKTYDLDWSLPFYTSNIKVNNYFNKRKLQVASGHINTWDYQYFFSMWENKGLAIIPNVNLIENIGINVDATHTTLDLSEHTLPKSSIKLITFNDRVITNHEQDNQIFNHKFYIPSTLFFKIKYKAKQLIGQLTQS